MTPSLEVQRKAVQFGVLYAQDCEALKPSELARETFWHLTKNLGCADSTGDALARAVTRAVFARRMRQPLQSEMAGTGRWGGDLDFVGVANAEFARICGEASAEEDAFRVLLAEVAGSIAGVSTLASEQSVVQSPCPTAKPAPAVAEQQEQRWCYGRTWKKQELADLVTAFKAGKTVAELCLAHNRTEGAILTKLKREGAITREQKKILRTADAD